MAVRASQARGRQAGIAHHLRCLSAGASETGASAIHEGVAASSTSSSWNGSSNKNSNSNISRRALFSASTRSADLGSRNSAYFSSTDPTRSCIDITPRRSYASPAARRTPSGNDGALFSPGDGRIADNRTADSNRLLGSADTTTKTLRPKRASCSLVPPTARSLSTGRLTLVRTRDTVTANGSGIRVFASSGKRWRDGRLDQRGGFGGGAAAAGIGLRWRNFASASSPPEPEQYLRYIHRVKPPQSVDEAAGGSSVDDRRISGESERRAIHSNGADSPHNAGGPNGGSLNGDRASNGGGRSDGGSGLGSRSPSAMSAAGVTQDDAGEDAHTREMTRKWLKGFTAEDILRDKTLLRQQLETVQACRMDVEESLGHEFKRGNKVRGDTTVDEAVTAFVNERVTSFVVVNRRKEVIGMFTSRDLLTELAKFPNKADGLKSKAHEFMIPLAQMIYCSPKDSLYQCLLVMSELKVRNLPVVSEGKVMGIVNVNDISDFSFSLEELGGKKAYIKNISERKGLPKGVGLDPRQNRSGWKQAFSASVGAIALPHPHKMSNGAVSANTREHRHLEVAEDPALSEDAHFMLDVAWPTPTTDTVHYVGLADGVGSWRKLGVDPREFSHRLMHWASQYILSMAPGNGIGAHLAPPPPKPHQVLRAAWEYTIGEKVVGSSTACVAALDYDLEQLTFSNIGDCGVVVLRHIDSDVAGYMREKKTPRHLRDNDLRLAFISQQQLRSFNLPYQFGYTNIPENNANFETPRDAVNTSFPVRPGDIIVLATDGLYDNMELDDICAVALKWEYKWFGGPMEGLSEHNNAAMEDLAQQLGHRARELSLDSTRDSPFALLAKENDIMWGGGMPDDITIVALRVINKAQSSAAAISKRGVGTDDQHGDEAA